MYTISYRTGLFRRKIKVLHHEMKDYLQFVRAKDGAICAIPSHLVKELVVYADSYAAARYPAVPEPAPQRFPKEIRHEAPQAEPAPTASAPQALLKPEASVSHLHPVDLPQEAPRTLRSDPAMQTEIMRRAMARMTQQE